MWFILSASILVIFITTCILTLKRRKYPPGPMGIPLLGYLPFLDPAEPYITLTKLSQKYGSIYGVQLGKIFTVVLSDVGLIRDTLKRDEFTGRAPLYITHGIMGGYGIICAEGAQWSDQRKLSIDWLRKLGMVKFGSGRDSMEQRIMIGIREYTKDFKSEIEKRFSINPFHILHNALGNVMNDFVFGQTYEKDDETWKYLQHLQEEGVKHIGVSGVVNFLPFLRFLPSNSKTIKFLLEGKLKTHKIYDGIIEMCRNNFDHYNDCVLKYFLNERTEREKTNNNDLRKYCSDEQLRHLLADIFGAGVDTTFTTIRWFILFTALHQDIQDKLRAELKSVLCEEVVALSDMEKLPLIRATIAETQRIRSVVPLGIPHGTTKNTKIMDYEIPKGTMVIPLLWAIHMDDKNWKDPEKFDPTRFLSEDGQFVMSSNLIPFQTGKRMCLGEEMAKMLLFLFCANFINNFKYEMENPSSIDTKGICGITLMPPEYSLIMKNLK
uniref:CSON015291 protein n=1 Tax=Culicoides sonorensis TaxID=179676 RepID=A0A336MQD5_CULSO